MKIRIVWLVFETSRNLRNFACPDSRKMAIFQYFRGCFRKVSSANVKVELFRAKFGQELKFGILMKIRIVWLVFETSRNLRSFAFRTQPKWPFFSILGGVSEKFLWPM